MNDRIKIEANEEVSRQTWHMYGLALAIEALGGDNPKSTLPGFQLAVALIEKELAIARAIVSGAVYRCAAKAGHDVGALAGIRTSIKDNKAMIELEPADLVSEMKDQR